MREATAALTGCLGRRPLFSDQALQCRPPYQRCGSPEEDVKSRLGSPRGALQPPQAARLNLGKSLPPDWALESPTHKAWLDSHLLPPPWAQLISGAAILGAPRHPAPEVTEKESDGVSSPGRERSGALRARGEGSRLLQARSHPTADLRVPRAVSAPQPVGTGTSKSLGRSPASEVAL